MSSLSPLFLWLIPLALLPVIIHLLNRLRYQTVHWAAMMFLRSADRDASRRARIRQWIILAARCLMLLMFLLALARLQSKGRLARFFDPGSNVVVILFDRSASMELERGGISGRERALALVQQGLQEVGASTRVLWMDSVNGEVLPIPKGVELERLPVADATSTTSEFGLMVRRALAEIARADVAKAEIWIPTDRQVSAWIPEGSALPEWTEWAAWKDRVTLRVLDVAQVAPDDGNRALTLVSNPVRVGDVLRVDLSLTRDTSAPEVIPLRIESGGLSLQEDLLVEGSVFQWEQDVPLGREGEVTHAKFSLPADTGSRDNEVFIAWQDTGVITAGADSLSDATQRIFQAAVLPRTGQREWRAAGQNPGSGDSLWITTRDPEQDPALLSWVDSGGTLLIVPTRGMLGELPEEVDPLSVETWRETRGVLATLGREPLRMDLLEVFAAVDLEEDGERQVLAQLSNGKPLLTRESMGNGVIYQLATLPDSGYSNLDDGFVLVPVLQRMLAEAAAQQGGTGTRDVGSAPSGEWVSLDGEELRIQVDAGRYRLGDQILAVNRPKAEDVREELPLAELEAWAGPLELRVFEDRSERDNAEAARSEFTGLLALLGLVFLVIESWLLTRNIRRSTSVSSAWGGSAA